MRSPRRCLTVLGFRGITRYLRNAIVVHLRLTPEGRRELEFFNDAPILMDGKKKTKSGVDGADQVNLEALKKVSAFRRSPIVPLHALHGYEGAEGDLKPEELDADDFRGLKSELCVCEGARGPAYA